MTELQQYITSYFGITHENLKQVAELFQETELKKGEFYTKAGQYCEKLSFVQSGYIRMFAQKDDKEITQWISGKGYFITDLQSFIFKQRATWNMQALTDCTLFTIDKERYRKLNTTVPDWVHMEKQFISGCFVALEQRVFNHLSMTAQERYDQLFELNKEMFNHVPQQYIASMLGMSPETFSRIRAKANS